MKPGEKIKVVIERQDRLIAIMSLSSAINKIADALTTPVQVTIANCTLNCTEGIGISVDVDELKLEERKENEKT